MTTLALITMRVLASVSDPGHGEAPPGVSANLLKIEKWIVWGGYTVCVIGVVLAAIGMVLEHRRGGGGGEAMGRLGSVMIAAILIGSAATLVNVFA